MASADYPAEHALAVTLDQIAQDLQVLQRVVSQRVLGTDGEKKTLARADTLAALALQQVEGEVPVITYFAKSASIRVIPYADIALVGVPYTCVQNPCDFLAIPHEVGHYVVWNRKLTVQRNNVQLRDSVRRELNARLPRHSGYPYCYRWVEEIFADVCGCLIAGPVIAQDFQDLMRDKSAAQFVADDGEHPTPVLRPLIYTHVLRQGSWVQGRAWADALDAAWKQHTVNDRGDPQAVTLVCDEPVPLSDVWAIVEQLTNVIYGLFPAVQEGWWTGYLSQIADQNVDLLYPAFEQRVGHVELVEPALLRAPMIPPYPEPCADPEICQGCGAIGPWRPWVAEERFFAPLGEPFPDTQPVDVPPEVWIPVLAADGWATRGPTDGWCPGGGG
jgi:hypothetical protein